VTDYVHRPIGDALLASRTAPVAIVEGARAVGKTTMVRHQLLPAGHHYVTLANSETRAEAAADLAGWLRRLPTPVVIDEAQLLPGIALETKELVDSLGPGHHVVLTGSASIGRTGLGGADPLARRARRWTISPLTAWELAGERRSLATALFDGDLTATECDETTTHQLVEILATGGFPNLALPRPPLDPTQVLAQVRSDRIGLLADSALPELRLDAAIAGAALDQLLRGPGNQFNASRLSRTLSIDRRTIDRYLGAFERLFLVHWLTNLAAAPSRQAFSRAKVHPVDTALSFEALARSGVDLLSDREHLGALLESYVVNQVTASAAWSALGIEAGYWRQTGHAPREVDLVLADSKGRHVAVEVKTARFVGREDAAGIAAFAQARGLHRGYVVYPGTDLKPLMDRIWALPLSALSQPALLPPSA
jgi:predicted AAA+ superfamily ATPase